jgi:ribonuclease D
MADFTFIDTDEQLANVVDKWLQTPELAIDLEMEAHLHHYGLYLSLAQISDGKEIWLVDMLAIAHPAPFVQLMESSSVKKVFHDVSFDFRVLEEVLACHPKNVYDTKIAALLIGKESISLASLLREYFGVEKNEQFQRVDWMKRPLDRNMLSYAAGDVHYLLALKDKLLDELEKKGRLSWFFEECLFIEQQSYKVSERSFQDVKGARGLLDKERGILKELYAERERIAAHFDKPVFFIIPDKLLIEFAKNPPRSLEQWSSLPKVNPAVKRQAFRFVRAVHRAKPVKKSLKEGRRLTLKQKEEVDELLARRLALTTLGIEPYLVMTRDQAEALVVGDDPQFRSWQKDALHKAKIL